MSAGFLRFLKTFHKPLLFSPHIYQRLSCLTSGTARGTQEYTEGTQVLGQALLEQEGQGFSVKVPRAHTPFAVWQVMWQLLSSTV